MAGQPACSRSGCRPRNRLCTTICVSGAVGILLPAPTPPLPRFVGFVSVNVVPRQPLRPFCIVVAAAPDSLRRAWDPTRKYGLHFTEAGISTPVGMRSPPSACRALKSAIAVSVTARAKPPRGFRSSVAFWMSVRRTSFKISTPSRPASSFGAFAVGPEEFFCGTHMPIRHSERQTHRPGGFPSGPG